MKAVTTTVKLNLAMSYPVHWSGYPSFSNEQLAKRILWESEYWHS